MKLQPIVGACTLALSGTLMLGGAGMLRLPAAAAADAPRTTQAAVTGVAPATNEKLSLAAMSDDPGQWVMPSQNYAGTRHSTLNQITADNVANLKVAWSMSTGASRGHEGQPLVVGDTMYFQSSYPNHVYAIDLSDYHIKWEYTPTQDAFAVSVACCDLVNRGVAYA